MSEHERNLARFDVCQEVSISTSRPLMVQGDGDVIARTPITIQVVPDALQVIVPAVRAGRTHVPQDDHVVAHTRA